MTRSYPSQPGFGVGAVVIEDGGASSDVTDVRLVGPDEFDDYKLTSKALEVIRAGLKLAGAARSRVK